MKHQQSLGAALADEPRRDLPITPITISPSTAPAAVHQAASGPIVEHPTLTIDAVRDWIFERMEVSCDASEGLPDLLRVAADMEPGDRLRLLGELWPGFDRICVHLEPLLSMIRTSVADPETVIPELMTTVERVAFDALPDHITVFRGCGMINKAGCSWTLDRDIATKVPFMSAYPADQPILLTAIIPKHRAAALKLERFGREVIVFGLSDEAWKQESLAKPTA